MPEVMVDPEFSKWFITLGVGGVLAAFMFIFYRKDVKQYTELWKQTTEVLILVVKENTSSNSKLISMLESMERNQIRKGDIDSLLASKYRSEHGREHDQS